MAKPKPELDTEEFVLVRRCLLPASRKPRPRCSAASPCPRPLSPGGNSETPGAIPAPASLLPPLHKFLLSGFLSTLVTLIFGSPLQSCFNTFTDSTVCYELNMSPPNSRVEALSPSILEIGSLPV